MHHKSARRTPLSLLLLWLVCACAQADSAGEIDAKVRAAVQDFYAKVGAGRELAGKAVGMLVFPAVIKGGFVVGGEYGEGALLVGGQTVDYYNTAAASIGFQLGAQVKTHILLFMTTAALERFRASQGWEAGVDGSVALATLGAGGELDSDTLQESIIGFIFSNKGLMYNLNLEGSKITRLDK
jgi:lipid-binding SYLF domain-containing protein